MHEIISIIDIKNLIKFRKIQLASPQWIHCNRHFSAIYFCIVVEYRVKKLHRVLLKQSGLSKHSLNDEVDTETFFSTLCATSGEFSSSKNSDFIHILSISSESRRLELHRHWHCVTVFPWRRNGMHTRRHEKFQECFPTSWDSSSREPEKIRKIPCGFLFLCCRLWLQLTFV